MLCPVQSYMIYMGIFSVPDKVTDNCSRMMHTGVKNRVFIIDALSCGISYSYKLHILRFGEGQGKHVWNILIGMCVV
jgi:hypothetical protein